VFDRDDESEEQIAAAHARAENAGIHVAYTAPAFEYWLYLHFEYSARAFSTSAEVIKELKRHIPSYSKSNISAAELLLRLNDAVQHARRLRTTKLDDDFQPPNTNVDELVVFLVEQAKHANRLSINK
jgi:hypothetical protein